MMRHLNLALGQEQLLDDYKVHQLTRVSRQLLSMLNDDEPWQETLTHYIAELNDDEQYYASLAAGALDFGLDGWKDKELHTSALNRNKELLRLLSLSNARSHERRARAIDYIINEVDYFTGWEFKVAHGTEHQLGQEQPWWRPGDFVEVEALRARQGDNPDQLTEAGFYRISREQYLDRVRLPMIRLMLREKSCLLESAALIALYTVSRQERGELVALCEQLQSDMWLRAINELDHHSTAIPMKPLYSFPKEMRNLSMFYITKSDELLVASTGKQARPQQTKDAHGMIVEGDSPLQGMLFFDSKLVNRKDKQPDQFIQVHFDPKSSSILDALMHAIELLDIEPAVLEHIPRITAGIFNAAQRDKRNNFNVEGTFWDTDSGKRLCRIVGFDPENKRHRKRVQDVRRVLETIILHREVNEIGLDGKTYKAAHWSGPLLESRKEQIILKEQQREGMNAHHTYKSWSIAGALWKMVVPSFEGGAPSFMSLDERAFVMDQSDSLPFNLYWTLINRAYMNRLDRQGGIKIKLQTLCDWSGLQGRFDRPAKLRPKLVEYLDLMIRHGLLDQWECEELKQRNVEMDVLMEASLYVRFSRSQLSSIRHLLPPQASPHQLPELEPL